MAEGQMSVLMSERNKLEGGGNYNLWRLKMIIWLKTENMCEFIDSKLALML